MLKFKNVLCIVSAVLFIIIFISQPVNGAVIELLNGHKISGKVISKDDKSIKIEVSFEGSTMTMSLLKTKIYAFTNDKGIRKVLNEKKGSPKKKVKPPKSKKKEKLQSVPVKKNFDWPCFRGAGHNGISTEKDWRSSWSNNDRPKILWKKRIGEGYSSIAVVDKQVFTIGNNGYQDTLWCFDSETGKELWKSSYACKTGKYPGPRATPTVDNNTVYIYSREGELQAYNTASGKLLWKKNPSRKQGSKKPGWDFAGSPLVIGEMIIVNAGTSGTALNKRTGSIIWKTGKGKASYSTPVPVTINGQSVILLFGSDALYAVGQNSGKQMWKYFWKTRYDVNAADPIFHNNKIFISSGYNHGCALLSVTAQKAIKVYESKVMRNHFNSSVLHEGYLYGFDETTLKCIEFSSGTEKWAQRGLGKASLIIADEKLIVLSENGKLVIAKADPSSYKELAQMAILSGRCWSSPTLSNGRLYARNERGDMVCVDLRKK